MRKNLSLVFCFMLMAYGLFAQTTLRLEDAASFTSGLCAFDGARQSSYSGADNGFYINISNSSSRGITWRVNVPSAGTYTLRWRYANGGSQSATTARVLVNGATAVASASFPRTSSWTTWNTTTASVSLASGVNAIRLETISSSEFANIDWMEVVGNSPTAASCSGTPVQSFTLTTTTSPSNGGSITRSPNATSYSAGTVVTLTAVPASGFTFTGWSGAASGTSASVSVTMDANKTVTANFTQTPTNNFTLTTSVTPTNGGSITRSPNATSYASGTVVTLTAVPASGFTFTGWSGAVSGTATTVTVTMSANRTVTANFTQSQTTNFTLTTSVSPSNGGSITRSPNATSYASGTVVTLTAVPASGYSFSGWSGAVSGTSSSTTVTMSANRTVTANFTQNPTGGSANFALVGYATMNGGTTGGAGGTTVTVNTGTALQAAINSKGSQPLTIFVNGTITPSNSSGLSKIDVKDQRDISIFGVGTSGEFNGIGIKIWRAGNIILRNLRIHHVSIGDKDCISIEGPSDHIWVDHCELYNQFQGVGQDFYDALLDAKGASEYITYSWNYMHDSWKTSLAGSSESDTHNRRITMHHNFYENCNSRLPLYRGGQGHIFNNYYKDIASTTINSRIGACLQIENNYFLNSINPYVSAYSDVVGYGELSGNILVSSPFSYASDIREMGPCTLSIPYSYSSVLHSASQVPSIVAANVGVGKVNPATITTARMSDEFEILGADELLSQEVRDLRFVVYPNPSRGKASVAFELPAEGTVSVDVVDMIGRKVLQVAPATYSAGHHEIGVDLNTSEKGIYLFKLNYGGNTLRQKLVVEQ